MNAKTEQLICGLLPGELAGALAALKVETYRSRQVWQWLYEKRAQEWDQMTNLPVKLRDMLKTYFILHAVEPLKVAGEERGTRKLLLGLRDGESVEAVLIPAANRRTVCVSSQVGCKFNCAFCASGMSGFRRNLETGEIIGQVLEAARVYGDKPTHAVFMGIGEPLDNYENVLKSARIINDQQGLCIGARRITISTSGVIPGIQRLAGEGIQFELSVSLHAPSDDLRSRLMPVNKKYPLRELIETCGKYVDKTGRIITFEYTLIRGVNDSAEQARQLTSLLRPLACRVNLIPLSPVDEFEGAPSTPDAANLFVKILAQAGINATLRDSKGSSLKAACGQLRSTTLHHEEK